MPIARLCDWSQNTLRSGRESHIRGIDEEGGGGMGSASASRLAAIIALASLALARTADAQTADAAAAPANPVVAGLNHYFDAPNAPETYRALTGQGDPHIAPEDLWLEGYVAKPDPLLALILPGPADNTADVEDRCRTDYALQTLKARIAQLGRGHPYVRRWIEVQRVVFSPCSGMKAAGAPTELPPPLTVEDPALRRLQAEDRAYQAASLSFYRNDLPAALKAFAKIGHGQSPHRPIAIFMIAAIKAGSNAKAWETGDKPLADRPHSIADIQAILADPSLESIHPLALELLGWVAHDAPDQTTSTAYVKATLAALEAPTERLAHDPAARRAYALARADIELGSEHRAAEPLWLKDKQRFSLPEAFRVEDAMEDAARGDPMAAWALFPRSRVQGGPWAVYPSPAADWSMVNFAEDAAKGDGADALAWRRAALAIAATASFSQNYDAALWASVDAEQAKAARGDDQAIADLAFDFYHQVRLALASTDAKDQDGRFATALAHMKAFSFKDSTPYVAARHDALEYLMTEGRIDDARRLRDETPAAPQTAQDIAAYPDASLLAILAEDQPHLVAVLMSDAGALARPIVNSLSIKALESLAADPDTPPVLRANVARVAWARRYALGLPVDGRQDQLMRDLNPAMVKAWSSRPGRTVQPNDRAVLLDVLRSPALNIIMVDADRDADAASGDPDRPGQTRIDLMNHDDDNWWCAWEADRHSTAVETLIRNSFFAPPDPYGAIEFGYPIGLEQVDGEVAYALRGKLQPVLAASWAFQNQDPAETKALAGVASAPRLLSNRVLDWVAHPGLFASRDGQAEALALAVRTTRYGCYSDGPHGAYSKAAWRELHRRFPDTDWAKRTRYWFN